MLSLRDGDARSILALNNRAPLIALGDGEVFLRLQQNVFAVSMKSMPTAGNSVRRTIHLEYEPECIIFRHPFLFAFSQNCCDVFSLYDNEVVERLPLPGVLYGSKFGSGDTIYAASGNKLWMLRIHSLRSQLAGLIHRYQVSDAFHLLSYQKRSSAQYAMIERDLNVMAAYAHLYHGNATEAMHHFAGLVDVRELLRHLPELCPREVQNMLKSSDDTASSSPSLLPDDEQQQRDRVIAKLIESINQQRSEATAEARATHETMWLTAAEEEAFTQGWCAASPHNRVGIRGGEVVLLPFIAQDGVASPPSAANTATRRRQSTKSIIGTSIETIWKSVFAELPAADANAMPPAKGASTSRAATASSSPTSSPLTSGTDAAAPRRMVVEMGGLVTEGAFVAHCRHELKREMGCYITSTLSTSTRDQRRAAEFALLMLCLQSRNYSGAYRLVAHGSALCVQDCYWLLHDAQEFRLLVTLLRSRGLEDAAWALYVAHVAPKAFEASTQQTSTWMTAATQCEWAAIFQQHDATRRESSPIHSRRGGTPTEPQPPRATSLSRPQTPQPSMKGACKYPWQQSLDEIFVALDHMDITHLEVLLRERPDRLLSEDSQGNSLMMIVTHYLARVAGGPSSDAILSVVAFLVDSGCPLTHTNADGECLLSLSRRLFSPSFGLFFMALVSSQCTTRAQAKKYMQDESFAELLLLAGCDSSVWKSLGTWQGYVVNKSQLQSSPA